MVAKTLGMYSFITLAYCSLGVIVQIIKIWHLKFHLDNLSLMPLSWLSTKKFRTKGKIGQDDSYNNIRFKDYLLDVFLEILSEKIIFLTCNYFTFFTGPNFLIQRNMRPLFKPKSFTVKPLGLSLFVVPGNVSIFASFPCWRHCSEIA
jgi:hypothetical protein